MVQSPTGTLGIKHGGRFVFPGGTIPANGLARVLLSLPSDPELVGVTLYERALIHEARTLTNAVTLTFE